MTEPGSQHYLKQALDLARQAAAMDEVPVGALVVSATGEVLGTGHNRRETDSDPTAHAEIFALRHAAKRLGDWRLEGATLYVTLEPCPMCLAACSLSRVARVVYGASDAKGGAISLGYRLHENTTMNHRFIVESVDAPECGEILTRFFRAKRGQA